MIKHYYSNKFENLEKSYRTWRETEKYDPFSEKNQSLSTDPKVSNMMKIASKDIKMAIKNCFVLEGKGKHDYDRELEDK